MRKRIATRIRRASRRRIAALATGLLIFGVLLGCVPNYVSGVLDWSPNGRFLAFIHPKTQRLWLWDTQRQQAQLLVDQTTSFCQFGADGNLYFLQAAPAPAPAGEMELNRMHFAQSEDGSLQRDKVDSGIVRLNTQTGTGSAPVYFSPDRKRMYYKDQITTTPAVFSFFEADLTSSSLAPRKLFSAGQDFSYPRLSPDGKRVLYSMNNGIVLRDLTSQTTRSLVGGGGDENVNACPLWIDDSNFIYGHHQEKPDLNTLIAFSLDDQTTRLLAQGLQGAAPVLLPDGKIMTVVSRPSSISSMPVDFSQAVTIDAKTGQLTALTDELLGADIAGLDAAGGRIAALSGVGTAMYRDLKTGKRMTIWTSEEERLYAMGDALADAGATAQAEAAWKDLKARYSDSDLANWAMGRVEILQVTSTPPDLDAAYALARAGGSPDFAQIMFYCMWPQESRLAGDPEGDLIRKYATDASRKEFGFDSDATRDLIGLSGRLSDQYLFLKIDYASPADLDGLTFQDTELLFDYDSPDEGDKTITPYVQWDRGAERRVVIHSWHDSDKQSIYNAEIFNEKGERISHLDASGFGKAQYPDLSAVALESQQATSGSLVVILSREALGLVPGTTAYLQVCTMKGGIEEAKHLERPRETNMAKSQGEPPTREALCDIADAFGAANTAARIDADLKAGKPAIIQGYAAKIVAPPGPSTK